MATHHADTKSSTSAKVSQQLVKARTSMIAPAATMVAAWGVRRALVTGYRAATGNKPPTAADRDVSLAKVIAWTVVSASAVAVVEVLVLRVLTTVTATPE